MIARLVAMVLALAGAYVAVPLLAPYLPTIRLKVETPVATSLDDVVSQYAVREAGEKVSVITSQYVADWDNDPKHKYLLYHLSDQIPTGSREYTGNGNQLEANYESFLLSIRPTDDPNYTRLLDAYKFARTRGGTPIPSKKTKGKPPVDPKQQALNALVSYLERRDSGPTEARIGRALRAYYGDDRPQIEFPGGHFDNVRRVSTAPDLSTINAPETTIPSVDFVVPGIGQSTDGAQTARAQQLKLVSLTILRPWFDLDLLRSSQTGPWYGSPPSFFGPTGTLARIPIRIVLLQRPQIQAPSAKVDTTNPEKVQVGPFSYSKDEIGTNGKILTLKPARVDWIVYAIVYREL